MENIYFNNNGNFGVSPFQVITFIKLIKHVQLSLGW